MNYKTSYFLFFDSVMYVLELVFRFSVSLNFKIKGSYTHTKARSISAMSLAPAESF